jgi:hypothetical protein
MSRILLALALLALSAPQDDVDAKIKAFTEAMKGLKTDAERKDSIDTLAKTRHLKAAQKLVTVIAGPYSDDVKIAAADAVGRIGEPKAGPALQSVLNAYRSLFASESQKTAAEQRIAEAVIGAIGSCRDRTAVPLLTPLLTKNNIPLIGAAVRALAKIRDPGCLDPLMRLYYAACSAETGATPNPRRPLREDALAALRRITGQKHTAPNDWMEWWKTAKATFRPPPEDSLSGLPPDVKTFAVYSGVGEAKTLDRFDMVLLDPANYTKDEVSNLKALAIALSGDPKDALDKGFAGAVILPEDAADARKKFPKAILISRGGAAKAAPHVNAILVDDLNWKRPDDKVKKELSEARLSHEAVTLALFVEAKLSDAGEAIKWARDLGYLVYVAPEKDLAKIATHTLGP